ncbi:MAG: hypothetical protein IPK60_02985 [Sandaracinaceae bacterium]|nr:hypothetical protein [Sandaracinaceae bacterium]
MRAANAHPRSMVAQATKQVSSTLEAAKTSRWAKWLAVTTVTITLSAFRDWRIEVGGLLMHPHLILTAIIFVAALFLEIDDSRTTSFADWASSSSPSSSRQCQSMADSIRS